MSRKPHTVSMAALAAIGIIGFASIETTGANAQQGTEFETALSSTSATDASSDEIIPLDAKPAEAVMFTATPVVQELPQDSATAEDEGEDSEADMASAAGNASSLRELVAKTSKDGKLSRQMKCLAGAIYFESRGEPLEGQLAVAKVIVNRSDSSRFPSNYCGVVYQRAQFSFVRGGKMPRIKYGSNAWKRAVAVARIAHNDSWDSKADDALYFHAHYVKPSWAKRKTARATINSHIFYR